MKVEGPEGWGPRSGGPAGVSHGDPESPNVHFGRPRPSKTPPKFNEKTPRESRKTEILGGRRKKKKILGSGGRGSEAGSGEGVSCGVEGRRRVVQWTKKKNLKNQKFKNKTSFSNFFMDILFYFLKLFLYFCNFCDVFRFLSTFFF